MSVMYSRTDDILIEKVKRDSSESEQPMHFHPYYELIYLVNGRRQLTIDHSVFSMEKGDIALVNKESLHKSRNIFDAGGSIELIGLYVNNEYMKPFITALGEDYVKECFEVGLIKIPNNRRDYVEDLLGRMVIEYNKVDEMSHILLNVYFVELMAFIVRVRGGEKDSPTISNPDDEIIAKAAEFIYKNYHMDITLESMAKQYSMSKSHFSRRFKIVIGCGFKEYLINVRLKGACERLLNTNESITEIATQCGFSDSNYFGDAFKKVKGVSPKQYRQIV